MAPRASLSVLEGSRECPRCKGSGRIPSSAGLRIKRQAGDKRCQMILKPNFYRHKDRPCLRPAVEGKGFCLVHGHMAARILTGGI